MFYIRDMETRQAVCGALGHTQLFLRFSEAAETAEKLKRIDVLAHRKVRDLEVRELDLVDRSANGQTLSPPFMV